MKSDSEKYFYRKVSAKDTKKFSRNKSVKNLIFEKISQMYEYIDVVLVGFMLMYEYIGMVFPDSYKNTNVFWFTRKDTYFCEKFSKKQ